MFLLMLMMLTSLMMIPTAIIMTINPDNDNGKGREKNPDTCKAFSIVFFAHPIGQMFRSFKPRDCGFESHRRRYFVFFKFPFLKKNN